MTNTLDSDASHRTRRRGGNRLTPEHPSWGRTPAYRRRRCFEDDPERRDRNQRTRARRAVNLALARGELSPILALLLGQLLDRCNDTLLGPGPNSGPQCSGWWSLSYIARLVHTADHYSPDAPLAGQRTAGRWMAALVALGWIESLHRLIVTNGQVRSTSNLWRIRIPDHLRDELQAIEDGGRARNASRSKDRPTPRAPQNNARSAAQDGQAAAAARIALTNAQRARTPCTACDGAGWVEDVDPGQVTRCAICEGRGIARAGP